MDLRLAGSRRFRLMVSAALVLARLLVTSGESWAANYFGSIHVASTKVRNYNDSIFAAAASVPHPMRYLESGNEANNPTAFAIASNEPAESPDTSQSAPHPSVVSNAPTVVVLRKPTSKPTEERTHNPTGSPTYPPRNLLTIDPSRWSIPSPLSEPSQTPSDEESFLQTLSPSQKLSRNLSTNPTQKSARLHTISPTYFSTNGPTSNQTQRPSSKESPSPTIAPSSKPSKKLTGRPSSSPTIPPTLSPSRVPTQFPTSNPSHQPTYAPTLQPSKKPTRKPTRSPTIAPTIIFTKVSSKSPTQYSTANPSRKPTPKPSLVPTSVPSSKPTNLSKAPAKVPIQIPPPNPSQRPFLGPSTPPSNAPSSKPTNQPTRRPPRPPTPPPTRESTISPSKNPIQFPTPNPSRRPSSQPSPLPSNAPSSRPTNQPTRRPSRPPTSPPTNKSTFSPSKNPIPFPTPNPSRRPSSKPSPLPSNAPSRKPTNQPTIMPFQSPTSALTNISTKSPSDTPTHLRTFIPSLKVTEKPSSKVSPAPSRRPTNEPFRFPTNQTQIPSRVSTRGPSKTPPNETESNPSRTGYPTDVSTINPAHPPSSRPSIKPTQIPSSRPVHAPTQKPSRSPTKSPTQVPSRESDSSPLSLVHDQINYLPSLSPSETSPDFPLLNLSNFPTKVPLVLTSSNPSSFPSGLSDFPTKTIDSKTKPVASPTNDPTALPSLAATSTPFSASKLGTSMPTESYATMDALLHFKVQFNRPFTDAELGTFEDSLESFLEDNLDGKNFSVQISQYNATVISQTIETEESIGGRALETSSSLIVSAYVVAIGIPAVRANDFPFQLFTHEALSENSDAFYDSFFSSSGFHQDDSSLTQQEGSIKFPRSGSVENDEGRQSQSKSTPIAVGSFAGAFCLFTTAAVLLLLMRRRLNRTASDGDEEQPPSAQAMEDDVSSLDGSDDGCITGRDRYPKNIPHLPGHNDRLTPEPSAVATGIKNATDTSNTIFASDRWSLDETCRLEKNTTSDQLNDPYFSGDSSHDSSIVAPMKLDVFVPVTDDFDYTDPPAVVKENFEDSNAKDARKMESKQKLHSKEIGENDEEFGRCSQDDFVDLVEDEPVQVKGRRKGLGMFSCFTDHTFQEVSDQSLSAPQLFGAKFTSRVSTPRSSGIEYEVRAPPGPLGLVVDSSNRGLVIHSVKPNSPLSNQVQAGDVILSLDGANCTKMSPEDLGNWISSKPLKEKQTVRLLAVNDDELSV